MRHADTLAQLVKSSDRLMPALRCVDALSLRSWCIGAGVVRSLVWDELHGFDPSVAPDVDVVHFDPALAPAMDAELERRLRVSRPALDWEVTNQAHVHRWFEAELGRIVAPLRSLEEGIATWPEFATCVGVWLGADGSVKVIAPHGLDDLFDMRVRHNPARATVEEFRHRVRSKRFSERWPRVVIEDA